MYREIWRKIAFSLILLASVGTIVVTVRSFFAHDSVRIGTGRHQLSAVTLRGQLRLDYRTPGSTAGIAWDSQSVSLYRLSEEFPSAYLGFGAGYQRVTQRGAADTHLYKLLVPIWVVALVPMALLSVWVWRSCRRRRRGGCRTCGYELADQSEQCPECGRVVVPSGRIEA